MLLCTALLQLHLKQKCLQQNHLPEGPQTGNQVLDGCQIDQNQSSPEPFETESKQQLPAKREQSPPLSEQLEREGQQQQRAKGEPSPSSSSLLICDNDEQQDRAKSKPTSCASGSGKAASDDCFDASQNQSSKSTPQPSTDNDSNADLANPAQPIKIAGLMIDPEQLAGSRGQTFLATIGSKLDRYWKISIHWFVKLRNYLHRAFTLEIMSSLATADP